MLLILFGFCFALIITPVELFQRVGEPPKKAPPHTVNLLTYPICMSEPY